MSRRAALLPLLAALPIACGTTGRPAVPTGQVVPASASPAATVAAPPRATGAPTPTASPRTAAPAPAATATRPPAAAAAPQASPGRPARPTLQLAATRVVRNAAQQTEFPIRATGLAPGQVYCVVLRSPDGRTGATERAASASAAGPAIVVSWFLLPGDPPGTYTVELRTPDGTTLLDAATFTIIEP